MPAPAMAWKEPSVLANATHMAWCSRPSNPPVQMVITRGRSCLRTYTSKAARLIEGGGGGACVFKKVRKALAFGRQPRRLVPLAHSHPQRVVVVHGRVARWWRRCLCKVILAFDRCVSYWFNLRILTAAAATVTSPDACFESQGRRCANMRTRGPSPLEIRMHRLSPLRTLSISPSSVGQCNVTESWPSGTLGLRPQKATTPCCRAVKKD